MAEKTPIDETLDKLARQIETKGRFWLDDTLDKHAEKIGHVAMAWSRMQEHLGQLFVYLVSPHHLLRGWAAWHAIMSDLAQRQMLAAVLREAYKDKNAPMRVEIEWILSGIQEILDNRNGAIHVAFQFGVGDDDLQMVPVDQTGNPRAKKLAGRDLQADFEFTSLRINRLGLHAKALAPFLRPPPFQAAEGPLPQRPPAPIPRPTKVSDRPDGRE